MRRAHWPLLLGTWEKGPGAEACSWPLGIARGREVGFPLEPPEGAGGNSAAPGLERRDTLSDFPPLELQGSKFVWYWSAAAVAFGGSSTGKPRTTGAVVTSCTHTMLQPPEWTGMGPGLEDSMPQSHCPSGHHWGSFKRRC